MTRETATRPTAHGARPSWTEVRETIADCCPTKVIELLAPHEPAELKGLHTPLKALHTELRRAERTDYRHVYQQYAPLLVAALMSAPTPAQAAWWLSKPMLLHATWAWGPNSGSSNPDHGKLLALLTARRGTDWTGDLACRLATGMRANPDRALWQIASGLAEHSRAEVPLSDGYVVGWAAAGSRVRYRRPGGTEEHTLASWLRAEPRLGQYIARTFEIPGLGSEFVDPNAHRFGADNDWPKVLAKLCAEGRLVRGEIIDACAARLLAGDRPGSLRGHIMVHEQLAPTPTEIHDRLPTYLGMAATAPGVAAKLAQDALRRLDTATALDTYTLVGLSTDVFSRAETGLASRQLGWIDATLKKNQDAAPILLPSIGTAFTHPAVPIQQRALRVAAKHLHSAGADVISTLCQAAQHLDPALRDDARRVFSAPDAQAIATPASSAPVRLPPYQPAPMPSAVESLDELVTAFTPVLANTAITPLEAEQLMAAVAIHADRHREALAAALAPLRVTYPPQTIYGWQQCTFPGALRCLFDAAVGEDHRQFKIARLSAGEATRPIMVTVLRINELTDALLVERRVPALLATPTMPSGAIDVDVLRARLAMYEQREASPLKHDLQQALIRVSDSERDGIHAELSALPALPAPIPALDDYLDQAKTYGRNLMPYARPLGMPSGTRPETLRPVGEEATSPYWVLVPPFDPHDKIAFAQDGWNIHCDHWPILLPHDPELLAAHAIPILYRQANGEDRSGPTIFPHLAETAGTPGPITHLALAYGLTAERLHNRVAAQDALLTLAARDLLQPAHLGRLAAELWRREMIRPKRLITSLQEAEKAGAATQVFTATATAIDVLATTPDTRGLPDLLLLATRCAANAAAGAAQIPGLAALTTVRKPARVGQEANRLLEALSQ
ncbi:DUF6493 family protein [Actinospica robiniae]|uniref:DUF7825 domain-containing protein n=1 Tax=Actinospica robiniae TaxID=304901 RepID=UPI000413202D|nr:DUF6493 family protein [Actinospica robiniae]